MLRKRRLNGFRMDAGTLVLGKTTNAMVKEFSYGQMGHTMWVIGDMTEQMAKVG